MQIQAGIQVSLDQSTWYKLTDHNRQPIKVAYEVIDKTNRMADGTLRRYVIAIKHKITASWTDVPRLTSNAVDYVLGDSTSGKAGAWMKSFYEANVFTPIYVKLIIAGETNPSSGNVPDESTYYSSLNAPSSSTVYQAYITAFDYEPTKRNSAGQWTSSGGVGYDLVNINIEFTEV